MRINPLFWRALGAFLALPGIVAFVVPWLLRPDSVALHAWGLVPLRIAMCKHSPAVGEYAHIHL